ncbi:MAG TPA: metallopeptidase family protein [Candidatus Saccharimonadales bacterium]|nr:metallopeptidase family protein [Candidatus Saccharimonadales bacterium]
MIEVSDEQFADMIEAAYERLPKSHMKAIKNVAIVYEDEPTAEQRVKLKLRCDQTLFGLYEGVPLTQRGGHTNFPPDKITLFKQPMLHYVDSLDELREQVRHTLWHEIAHYFGLDHEQIHTLEGK